MRSPIFDELHEEMTMTKEPAKREPCKHDKKCPGWGLKHDIALEELTLADPKGKPRSAKRAKRLVRAQRNGGNIKAL